MIDPNGTMFENSLESFGEDLFREILIMLIDQTLRLEYDYEGPNDYNAMYWYAKGIKTYNDAVSDLYRIGYQEATNQSLIPSLPKSHNRPKRYDETDEYINRQQQKAEDEAIDNLYNISEQPLIKHLQIPHLPKSHNRPKRYDETDEYRSREQMKADEMLFKNITNKYKENINPLDKIDNEKRKRLQKKFKQKRIKEVNDYNNWKQENVKQDQIIKDIMENLERTPTDWELDFEQLNDYGKKQIFPQLLEFFRDHIDSLPIIEKYKLQYKIDGVWHTKQLSAENYKKLMDNFTEENFIFDIDQKPPEYFYEQGSEELPAWSLFSAIKFCKYIQYDNNKGNNDVGGSFFQYLTADNVPSRVVDYLKRLQIFDL